MLYLLHNRNYNTLFSLEFSQDQASCKEMSFAMDVIDQSDYQTYGPNLQKIATETKPFDFTPYTYWLVHIENPEQI